MSKIPLSKVSSLLIGLSMIAASAYPALAIDSTSSATKPNLRSQVTTRSTILQEKLETRQQNLQAKVNSIQERIASKEAALRLKLQTFKDQKKAQIVERINALLNKINQNQTTQMGKNLDTMSNILGKLENRVTNNTPDIKNPEAANEAIASASAAISAASEAVTAQAEKDYIILVTSESRVATDSRIQRDKLHSDLSATRKLVRDAKKAVSNAIRVARGAVITEDKEATNSGQ